MKPDLDKKQSLLLAQLINNFRIAGLQLPSYDMPPGAGQQPLAFIAVRVFRGLVYKYEEWLQSRDSMSGTPTALELMVTHNDPEYWVVRYALMQRWLGEQGYVVPPPPFDHKYRQVTLPGGFTTWVPVEKGAAA